MRRPKVVLQLNADLEPLDMVTIKSAISKITSNKARILEENKNKPILHPVLNFRPPMIIKLNVYVYVPYLKAKNVKKNILARDKYKCQYCGIKLGKGASATIDHIIPKCKKPRNLNSWTNKVACCQACNNRKGDRSLSESGMILLRKPFVPKSEDLLIHNEEIREMYHKIKGRV